MMKRLAYGLLVFGGISLLAACAAEKKPLGVALKTNDLVFSGTTEPLSDKVNVYESMARAAKYNVDAAAQNSLKKVYGETEKNPEKIAENILFAGQATDRLYNAAKAMDFADIYALSVLADNQNHIENILYAKSAQNLSVAAIRLHREEIFAAKEISKIDRLMNQQGKILSGLNKKLERDGELTAPELNYRKDLEVALNNLAEIKKQLVFINSEYAKLIKAEVKGLKLEGKRFYELEDFDKRYRPDVFQDSAVSNRREFSLAKEQLGGFNAAKARRQAFVDYPPVARLDINGLEIEDSRYESELFNKAERVIKNVLSAIREYQKNPAKETLKQKAFDELAALVMTQVELGYRLVEKADFDYEANRYKIAETKAIIRKMEKKKNLPEYEKIDLLDQKIQLIALEQKEAQVLAERGAALRNLYYLAGLSPFDKLMLKGRIKDIETVLRQSFNKDLVDMLSAVKEAPRWNDGGNAWAHKDRWLEELIENPVNKKTSAKQNIVKTSEAGKKTIGSSAGYSMMQLGAYTDAQNAYVDMKRVSEVVPALSGKEIFVEEALVNGVVYHRLLVRGNKSQLKTLCNEVIDAGFGCILK